MLFNDIKYLIFFTVVFIVYWAVLRKNRKAQNIFLLISSYYFYASWDYRFAFLLAFSTLLDFVSGLLISKSKSKKMALIFLITSVSINLGLLGYFKYVNFFIDNLNELLSSINNESKFSSLNIILPVGISFYTFHGLSYVFDIYNKKIVPTKNIVDYSLFVSFFPLLVAGPIERAQHLLPQVESNRTINTEKIISGLRQILWGLFKKIVIADQASRLVDVIFGNPQEFNSLTLFTGAVLFAFQIYCDFSGYSDIALGSARMLGFELLKNFSFPYFSRDIAEFWRRWHISLSSWFRDYIYIPLGGSRVSKILQIRNTLIIFTISGFWHGANWTFIIWGLLNALYFIPLLIINKNRKNINIVKINGLSNAIINYGKILLTFLLVTFSWIFFRAENVTTALDIINEIFDFNVSGGLQISIILVAPFILIMIIVEWIGREWNFGIECIGKLNIYLRWAFYYFLIFLVITFSDKSGGFIYFQF